LLHLPTSKRKRRRCAIKTILLEKSSELQHIRKIRILSANQIAMKNFQTEPDDAARIYHGASGRKYHEEKRALNSAALEWVMSLRAEKFQRHVRADDTVFEFGVGSGWNLGKLRSARRIGCDTSEFLKERVEALGIEFIADISAMPDATADVVICHQTLEHLLEPAKMLKESGRILKPQGKLILHVPWERERRYSHYRADEPNHHLYNWNAQNVGNLITVLGYKIESIKISKYGYDRFAANLAACLRAGGPGFRIIRSCMVALRPLLEVEVIAVKPLTFSV
jgi:SAM-dependent methyltransferase